MLQGPDVISSLVIKITNVTVKGKIMERWEGSEEDLQGAFLDNYIPPSLPLFCTPTPHLCTTPCSWNNPEYKFSDSLDYLVCVCAKGI